MVGPGVSLADRFLAELARHRTQTTQALPAHFRPLSRTLVGERPVRVATGAPTRRALAAVGKEAATTGGTIHLARRPDSSRRSVEIVAHELTHAASPSPEPRFFDDDRDSPEERRAEVIGRIMARNQASVAPPGAMVAARADAPERRVGTAHLPVGSPMHMLNTSASSGPPVPAVARRARPDSGDTVTADQMIQRLTAGGGSGGRIQRSPDHPSTTLQRDTMTDTQPSTTTSPGAPGPSGSGTPDEHGDDNAGGDAPSLVGRFFDGMTSSEYHDFVDAVVDALEDRIVGELERRGGHLPRRF